ncbi:hypothetical protein ABEB36_014058 [Hypothenemus hampei]|uniref:Uncharacterized protein n=1 Tax=Hypothenemus hampei TaxID=57062 RepID=A0ABD1E361_HYPHA
MPFSNEETYDMFAVYFRRFENAAIAAREYCITYPLIRHYSKKVFKRLAIRLKDTGNVRPTRPITQKRRSRNEENVTNILLYGNYDPQTSTREIERELEHKLHPYHIVLHQALSDKDFDNRLNFCHWLENMMESFGSSKFPSRWTGRGSIFPWPPRSPDLTCLDFYFWGRIKDLVYRVLQPGTI